MTAPASRSIPALTHRGRLQSQRAHRAVLVASLGHCVTLLDRTEPGAASLPVLGILRATIADARAYAPELRMPETLADAPTALQRARGALLEQGADGYGVSDTETDFRAWLNFECARGSDNYVPPAEADPGAGTTLPERQQATAVMTGLVHADACAQWAEGDAARYAALALCRSALWAAGTWCSGLWKPADLTEARQLVNKAAAQLADLGVPRNGYRDAVASTAEWLAGRYGAEAERLAPESLSGGVLSVLAASLRPDAAPPADGAVPRPGASYTTPPGNAPAAVRGTGEGIARRPMPGS